METLLAALLFSLAVVSAAGAITAANHHSARSSQRLAGELLATRFVESAIDEAKAGAVPKPETGTYEIRTVRRGAENKVVYTYEVTVDDTAAGLKDVTIKVVWIYQGQEQSIFREVLVYPVS